jgi:hypothetical protein
MQVVQDQQVVADSRVAGEFSVRHSGLTACIRFSQLSCSCVDQSWRRSCWGSERLQMP